MSAKFAPFALVIAAASLALSVFALKREPAAAAPAADTGASRAAPTAIEAAAGDAAALEPRLAALESALGVDSTAPLDARLDALEASLAKLQNSFDGISLESASEDRDAVFREPDGHLRADEYFAAGKFAVAGEGYLAFLESHPDHPDAYDILKRARNAFRRAGYDEKAIWAQQELIKNLGERRDSDVLQLAQMEKDAGLYDDAIAHAAEASELASEPQQALWHKMYWAWYHQLRDGEAAGLDAYRQIEQEIADGGYTDGKLGERVREKIEELERNRTADGTRTKKRRASS